MLHPPKEEVRDDVASSKSKKVPKTKKRRRKPDKHKKSDVAENTDTYKNIIDDEDYDLTDEEFSEPAEYDAEYDAEEGDDSEESAGGVPLLN